MKSFLLVLAFAISSAVLAQTGKVASLPTGTYEVQTSAGTAKFPAKGIVLLDDSHYKIINDGTVGDYKFSATAQRVLFLTGALKSVYAKTVMNASGPAIMLPLKENGELGLKLADSDIWAFYKKE